LTGKAAAQNAAGAPTLPANCDVANFNLQSFQFRNQQILNRGAKAAYGSGYLFHNLLII